MEEQIGLVSAGKDRVSLKSVHIEGQVDGLLLMATIRQHYKNETSRTLEVIYTFPLAWGATLMGLMADIAGKRLRAVVLEKKTANARYEQAIDEGDSPIMVEQSASGLYTANLGNLKPGEALNLEIRYAQLLRFEQGQVRLTIPTVIASRYGNAHGAGLLAAHETADVDPLVEYPFTLRLDISDEAARAKVHSPSHAITTQAMGKGMSVLLEKGAVLDRDFILCLDDLAGKSFALVAPDGEHYAMLASFCLGFPSVETEPLCMKILVDCSGSMQGDSITSAREGLRQVAQALKPVDFISYSRFGSYVEHDIDRLTSCSPDTIRTLVQLVSCTDAHMGGTEMRKALFSVFKIKMRQTLFSAFKTKMQKESSPAPCVFLITDGEVWGTEDIISTSIASGQRIFAIGVGSAPAESLLRELAEKTGGACELVSPNEDISGAILRMFHRMRSTKAHQLQVEWGSEPVWQSPLPLSMYGGETLHVFGRFHAKPQQLPVLKWTIEGKTFHAIPKAIEGIENSDLSRLLAAKEMMLARTPETALDIALKYQLISRQSSLFLVHEREDGDKANGLPTLQQVKQMQAAGWGGYGSVRSFTPIPCFSLADVPMFRRASSLKKENVWGASIKFQCAALVPDTNNFNPVIKKISPKDLLDYFNALSLMFISAGTKSFSALTDDIDIFVSGSVFEELVEEYTKDGMEREAIWAVILNWLIHMFKDQSLPDRHAERILCHYLKAIPENVRLSIEETLESYFGDVLMDDGMPEYDIPAFLMRAEN